MLTKRTGNMVPVLLLTFLFSSIDVARGTKCYNTGPTRAKCLGYVEFPSSVMDNLFTHTNYTGCVQWCAKKPACVLIQWSYEDRLCHLVHRKLAKRLEQNGKDCLHFRKQNCNKNVTVMSRFSDYAFEGGLLVRGVESEDYCRAMCSNWETCSAYSWSRRKFTLSVGLYCRLHQKIPQDTGLKVIGNQRQGIKPGRFVLETSRSHVFKRVRPRNEKFHGQNKFRRILECADSCVRLPACRGITWFLDPNQMNCLIHYESLPMYLKQTLA